MIDSILLCLKGLGKKRLRTFLTVFSISIGVASVLIISTVSDFGKTSVISELDSLGLGGIAVSCSGSGKISGEKADIIQDNENVDTVMPIIINTSQVLVRNNALSCIVFGVDSNAQNMISLEISHGKAIDQYDVGEGKNICMIDANLAQSIYKRENIVGKSINLNINNSVTEFEVVGIVKTGTGILQNLMGEYVPTFVYVPVSSLQKINGRSDFDQITVKLKEGVNVENASESIINTLERADGSGVDFSAENLSKQREVLERLLDTISTVLSAIGLISLIVAGMGIMTIMLVSVNERTREIGIKKSIGAKKSDILLEFLFEALILTLIGCIFGILFGMAVVYLGGNMFGLSINLNLKSIAVSVLISTVVGIIFGVYPAIKAANMKPVEALRTDS